MRKWNGIEPRRKIVQRATTHTEKHMTATPKYLGKQGQRRAQMLLSSCNRRCRTKHSSLLDGWVEAALCAVRIFRNACALLSSFSLSISFQTIWCHHHLHYFSFSTTHTLAYIQLGRLYVSRSLACSNRLAWDTCRLYFDKSVRMRHLLWPGSLSHCHTQFIFICATSIWPLTVENKAQNKAKLIHTYTH